MTPHAALIEALWNKPDLIKPQINQREVIALANVIIDFFADKNVVLLDVEDLWAFDETLHEWLNQDSDEHRLSTFEPLSNWQGIISQLPRKLQT